MLTFIYLYEPRWHCFILPRSFFEWNKRIGYKCLPTRKWRIWWTSKQIKGFSSSLYFCGFIIVLGTEIIGFIIIDDKNIYNKET